MITIGDTVPEIKLRTDEGTPLSLADLKGRAFVLFMLGETFSPTVERLLNALSKNVNRFLTLDVSPIAVLGDTVENLADYRDHYEAPFLLMSAAVLFASTSLMSAMAMEHPSSANFRAIPRPIPLAPPVIMATLFDSSTLASFQVEY